jgi:hypothetical protein
MVRVNRTTAKKIGYYVIKRGWILIHMSLLVSLYLPQNICFVCVCVFAFQPEMPIEFLFTD